MQLWQRGTRRAVPVSFEGWYHVIGALDPKATKVGALLRLPGDRLGYTSDLGGDRGGDAEALPGRQQQHISRRCEAPCTWPYGGAEALPGRLELVQRPCAVDPRP